MENVSTLPLLRAIQKDFMILINFWLFLGLVVCSLPFVLFSGVAILELLHSGFDGFMDRHFG